MSTCTPALCVHTILEVLVLQYFHFLQLSYSTPSHFRGKCCAYCAIFGNFDADAVLNDKIIKDDFMFHAGILIKKVLRSLTALQKVFILHLRIYIYSVFIFSVLTDDSLRTRLRRKERKSSNSLKKADPNMR